ncbi:MAG TPA: aromatic amino acid lyase, partial [Patescibacteria group bacterium]|nr:aromatic amino acid lyase [Patescibacteria group bacterium]
LASENKVLVHPASADSIPTSANPEDHVSMGATAASHARAVLDHVQRILALELLVAAQALDLRRGLVAADRGEPAARAPLPGAGVAEAQRRIRALVAPLVYDREMGADIAAVTRLVKRGALVDLVDA